jgi:hypothetical protein
MIPLLALPVGREEAANFLEHSPLSLWERAL